MVSRNFMIKWLLIVAVITFTIVSCESKTKCPVCSGDKLIDCFNNSAFCTYCDENGKVPTADVENMRNALQQFLQYKRNQNQNTPIQNQSYSCIFCNGTGVMPYVGGMCPQCGGSGVSYKTAEQQGLDFVTTPLPQTSSNSKSNKRQALCGSCNGKGTCPVCKGIPTQYSNRGTPISRCNYCKGTGKCPKCYGRGIMDY